jgi:peptidyl-prolyl cis-trans isomerase SurA
MYRYVIFVFVFVTAAITMAKGQQDPVLFTVDGVPVYVSEFDYIYSKSKMDTASYSRASLEEYLDLYKNFKLKVRRAKDMKLDTIPSLQKELAGYRKQLANSYLVDKEVTDKLIREAYDRSLYDVNISHIMISLKPDASAEEEKAAQKSIAAIQQQLKGGMAFEKVAEKSSDDKNTAKVGGAMGFLNATFPDGFYNLETAAYTTAVGKVSDPVRTVAGLHLVKVNEKRNAIGQMEVAHILIRNPKDGDNSAVKAKINKIHQQLKEGTDFETLAKEVSEDSRTATQGGYVGFIGVRHPFETSAFALSADNTFSEPFESSVGWHIVKRISKKPVEEFDIAKRRIQTRMQENQRRSKTPRFNRLTNARNTMIERIKREGNFKLNEKILNGWVSSLDSTFTTYKWKAPKEGAPEVLFSLSNKDTKLEITLSEFQDFCQRNSKRMRMGRKMDKKELVDVLLEEYVDDSCIRFEEMQLEEKYPEFKSLMREYEEGILLFEATKILVWDKASQDTTGLKEFFAKRKNVYKWNERAVASRYTVPANHADMVGDLKKKAKNKNSEELLAEVNKDEEVLSRSEKIYEKGKSQLPEGLEFKVGSTSENTTNNRNKAVSFYKIEKILPVANKELNEARGFVIADYQNFLEKQWIRELQKAYKIKVNQDVFKSLIQKQ